MAIRGDEFATPSTDRGYPTRANASTARELTLIQRAETISGVVDQIQKVLAEITTQTGALPPLGIEKDVPRPMPVSTLKSILEMNYEDLSKIASVLEHLREHVGRPGEGR